ncbi:prophage minor tail protein Z [Escherichia coli]|uniref:Prophage minor tail protein Z n=1 Tax=Escherichia coli TaxID=562 RepID=A0AB38H5R3_ECOLX|nr:prophage minor tail protein Z [Escherichia coli]
MPGDQGEPETGKGTVQLKRPRSEIRMQNIVNRGDLPVIKLGIRMPGRRPDSILKAGQHRYQRAFIQRLKNGRWHVMQRVVGKNRYPIDVVKIPMAAP